jgi:hypothetical protein
VDNLRGYCYEPSQRTGNRLVYLKHQFQRSSRVIFLQRTPHSYFKLICCTSIDGQTAARHEPDACNALNLGVEFFLLFTHQIQALLSFLFQFRSFFPISKRCNDWGPYYV